MSKFAMVELITAPSKLLYRSLILFNSKSISITFLDSTTLPTVTPWSKRFNVSLADSSFFKFNLFYFWLLTIETLLRIVDLVDMSLIFFLKSKLLFDISKPFGSCFGGRYFVLLYLPSWAVDDKEERFYIFDDLFLESLIGGVY